MEKGKKTHEIKISPSNFMVVSLMIESNLMDYLCDANDEWHKDIEVGDYVLLLKEPELEEKILLEVVKKEVVPNNLYSEELLEPKYNDDDSKVKKEFKRYYCEELSKLKNYTNFKFSLVKDLKKKQQPKRRVKKIN